MQAAWVGPLSLVDVVVEWGIRRTWVEVGVGVGVGKCVGQLGEVMRGWGSVGVPKG